MLGNERGNTSSPTVGELALEGSMDLPQGRVSNKPECQLIIDLWK